MIQCTRPIDEFLRSISCSEAEIREYINLPRYQDALIKDLKKWGEICSSLDLVGDTAFAIHSYFSSPYPDDLGIRYVILYGILQTLFLQQDATEHLFHALDLDYQRAPELIEIREIRNYAVGHPSRRERKHPDRGRSDHLSFHSHIARISISQFNFKLAIYDSDGNSKYDDINLLHQIKIQLEIIAKNLEELKHHTQRLDMAHKKQFSENPLTSIINTSLDYPINKIGEGIITQDISKRQFSLSNLNLVISTYSEFINSLKSRNEFSEFIKIDVEKYMHSLYRLKEFYEGNDSNITDVDAQIFFYYIRSEHKNFMSLAQEIDDEYKIS